MKIIEINDHADFLALEGLWNNLLLQCDHSIFSTWEWISTWWKYFGKDRNLKILLAMENSKVFGIAPLMVSKIPFIYNVTKINKVEFIGRGNADYNSFIFSNKMNEIPNFFIEKLSYDDDWDVLEFVDVSEESSLGNFFQSDIGRKFDFNLDIGNLCPHIDLPSSISIYISSLSHNLRKNLKKRMKKLCKNYKIEVLTQNDFSSIHEAMEIFLNLHNKRWKFKEGESALISKMNYNFHFELAKLFNEKKWLSLYFLMADNQPIAAIYSFNYNLKKYGYNTGFDPDFYNYGIGNLLKNHVIEDCINMGFTEYDLLRGNEAYKSDWATGIRKNYVIKMSNKSFRGLLFSLINKIR